MPRTAPILTGRRGVTNWRRVGKSDRTGIWPEAYKVRAGEHEAIYGNMRPFGLGKAGRLIPVSESSSARGRRGATTGGEVPAG